MTDGGVYDNMGLELTADLMDAEADESWTWRIKRYQSIQECQARGVRKRFLILGHVECPPRPPAIRVLRDRHSRLVRYAQFPRRKPCPLAPISLPAPLARSTRQRQNRCGRGSKGLPENRDRAWSR